jgi:hypothetical protein
MDHYNKGDGVHNPWLVQAIGPLKVLAGNDSTSPSPRFLIVTDIKDSSQVVLRQTDVSGGR